MFYYLTERETQELWQQEKFSILSAGRNQTLHKNLFRKSEARMKKASPNAELPGWDV